MTQESDCEKSQTLRRGEKRRSEVEGANWRKRARGVWGTNAIEDDSFPEFATGRKLDTTFGLGTESTK
jgi:hypothetical protein